MSETYTTFEELAAKAQAGDENARDRFRSEAARLFPADFGPGGQHEADLASTGREGLAHALAIIRQTTSTGG
jgi:hypothetical protein